MWQPQSGHVSQLQDGSGRNDCWEASLLRYLRECGKMDPHADPLAQLAQVDQIVRGIPDTPDNPYTTLSQAEQSLAYFGIAYQWTDNYQAALASYWAICLVNGIALTPAQYPPSWFGYENAPSGDHFILWLPVWQGADDWFNDPLSYANGQQDCRYDLGSVAGAFAGAFLLPNTGHGEDASVPGPVHPQPPKPAEARGHVTRACSLKAQPNHTSVGIAHLPTGGEIGVFARRAVTANEPWRWCQFRDKYGWLPESVLAR